MMFRSLRILETILKLLLETNLSDDKRWLAKSKMPLGALLSLK